MKVITIGRCSPSDILINDPTVSRYHLQLVQSDRGAWSVVDLNSANGTFVNGKKITGEVRLQPSDILRIGNTTLPWQTYIAGATVDPSAPGPSTKSNRKWWYIGGTILVVLLIGLAIFLFLSGKANEKEEARQAEQYKAEQLRNQADEKAEEARRLQEEADELFLLISQNENNRALYEAKQREANNKKKEADEALKRADEASKRADSAEKERDQAKSEAGKQQARADNESKRANEATSRADNEKKRADKLQAQTESDKETIDLGKKFIEAYSSIDDKTAKEVYKKLNLEAPRNNAKAALAQLFNTSSNQTKRDILSAIPQNKKENETAAQPASATVTLSTDNTTESPGTTNAPDSIQPIADGPTI